MEFIIVVFIVLVGGGWLIGKVAGQLLFPNKKEEKYTFNTTNIHIYKHEYKNISIIDDTTKKKIFELKESNENEK